MKSSTLIPIGPLAALVALLAAGSNATAQEYKVGDQVFGMPAAEIFTEDYQGPPVVGAELTHLPFLAPLAAGNHDHHIRVDIVAEEIEVAPGVRYAAWTFGGSVPGPVLHVREGDRVFFTMKNRSADSVQVTAPAADASPFLQQLAANDYQKATPSPMGMQHSIDFHAATVAPSDKWRMVPPGKSIRFQWVANYPGVYIYHCGAPPVLQHIAMGQYGVVVVSPREGYPTDKEVAREYVIVQSEFYLKKADEGDLYEFDMPAALAKQPTQVTFNGHTLELTKHPLIANAGERVRLYLHNVGPNDTASNHVIGAIMDRVWYEGNPHNEMRGMQTVLLGASNGAVVEFIASEEGDYPIVDHEFADASKGALGHLSVRNRKGEITTPVAPMAH
ncbi:MAG: multicopper oxidase domain-containing protein [Acidobacteriota bacterium]